jgi:hypothetical protein
MKTYTPITFSFKHFVPKNFLLHFEQFIDLQHCTVWKWYYHREF